MSGSTYLQNGTGRKPWGLLVVVLLHVLVFWGLQSGLSQNITRQMPEVVQAFLLQDTPAPAPKIEPTPPVPPAPLPPPPPLKPTPPPPQPAPPPPVVVAPQPTPPIQVPAVEVALPEVPSSPTQAITAAASDAPTNVPTDMASPASSSPLTSLPAPSTAAPTPGKVPARTPARVSAAQCEKPAYPNASRRMEEEGTVSLRFLVGVDGLVIQSEIEKSSGFKRLDDAARAGLSKCRFQPATVDGVPEQAWASMKYTWRLE
jgi:periplasmic protein TonB